MPVNLTPHALLFTVAAIGISETSYLIRKRIAAERPVCPIGEGCVTVLSSKWNRLFLGIHNDIAGMFFYVLLAAIAALLVIDVGLTPLLIILAQLLLGGATLMSLALIFLQWRVIRAWCFWCLMSAATVGFMDAILIIAFLR